MRNSASGRISNPTTRWMTSYNWVYRLLPWERWRALRMLDANTAAEMRELEDVRAALQRNESYTDDIAIENEAAWRRAPTYSSVDLDARRYPGVYSSACVSARIGHRQPTSDADYSGATRAGLSSTVRCRTPWNNSHQTGSTPSHSIRSRVNRFSISRRVWTQFLKWNMLGVGWTRFVLPSRATVSVFR